MAESCTSREGGLSRDFNRVLKEVIKILINPNKSTDVGVGKEWTGVVHAFHIKPAGDDVFVAARELRKPITDGVPTMKQSPRRRARFLSITRIKLRAVPRRNKSLISHISLLLNSRSQTFSDANRNLPAAGRKQTFPNVSHGLQNYVK